MKHWPTLALIIAGLSFVLYSQLARHLQPIGPAAAAAVNERQSPPPRKPASPAETGPAGKTFGEYPCPGDCSEDKAGYQWAQRNSIRDPDDCTGTRAAFIEGCRVYAEQQAAGTAD
ncbi:MAG TPA: hypothetical protein VEV21_11450 [Burkholderiales bacterium]|nr:hypothetical protein [Burkholderiales bacterium]